MTESFAQLFEESLATNDMRQGTILKGLIVDIRNDAVVVNAGLKSEGSIPIDQFYNEKGELEINVGDEVDVTFRNPGESREETVTLEAVEERHSFSYSSFNVDVSPVRLPVEW